MEGILNKRTYEISKTKELIETLLIILGGLLIPLFLPKLIQILLGPTSFLATNSQIIVGSIVNTALIIVGINLKGIKKILLAATLPSISAVAGGLIFGPLSIFMVYMMPAIWLGNLSLILLVKYLFVNKKANYALSAAIAITLKVGIIFATLNVLLAIALIPNGGAVATTLKYSMGLLQLTTATVGSIIAFGIMKLAYEKK